MTGITVRRATPADCARIYEIERSCFSDPWSLSAICACCGDGSLLTVIEDEKGIAGYMLALRVLDEAQIMRVAVETDRRRTGLGLSLMRQSLALAAEDGAGACFLEVRASNASAISLYRRCGFKEIGRRRNFYDDPREDALNMKLELDREK